MISLFPSRRQSRMNRAFPAYFSEQIRLTTGRQSFRQFLASLSLAKAPSVSRAVAISSVVERSIGSSSSGLARAEPCSRPQGVQLNEVHPPVGWTEGGAIRLVS